MGCLIKTSAIKELAKKFPKETDESIKDWVGLWQEKNNKSSEEYPTARELSMLIYSGSRSSKTADVEVFQGNWTREQVAKQSDKVFLFGDNTDDRLNTHHVPTSTQAVIRGLDNAIGIDTKKNRGTGADSYFTDDDFDVFKAQVDSAIKQAKDSGKTIVIPNGGIGTGKAMLKEKAPKLFQYLQDQLSVLQSSSVKEAEQMLGEAIEGSFDATQRVTNLETQQKVDLIFDPQTRRSRVQFIARRFSDEVTSKVKAMEDQLNDRIGKAMAEEDFKTEEELRKDLAALDRYKAIASDGPAGIFNRIRNSFMAYINDTDEGRVQAELNKINADEQALIDAGEIEESERFSDEEKLEAAKKRATYKLQEYQKIASDPEVFRALAEEASSLLVMTEGIRLDPNYMAPKDATFDEATPEEESTEEDLDMKQEEAFKDGWMTNFREVSSHESLSQLTRKAIREIPRLDFEGYEETDDLGNLVYLDADYVHATLLDKLRYMINSDNMIPLLQEVAKTKPWVEKIIELLQNDETLFSQFYQDFRKDFTPYWIQKKKMQPDGSFKMETIAINSPEGVYYLLDAWRDNYENGIKLDKDSIYDKNGEINKANAEKGLALVEALNNQFTNLDTAERLKLLEQENIWNDLMKALHMLGIDANPDILKTALFDIKEAPGVKFTDPIMLLLPQLNIIFKGVKDGKIESETKQDEEKRGDLINTFGSAYNEIAVMMAGVTDDAIESSVRENDKSYYSHTTPNYLGKLIKNLKNVMNNQKRFEEFMQTEFKDYEWFFKDGQWRNDWLRQLEESAELRKGLQHKVVLNSDKVDYSNWDDLDYTLALLTEYWGDPDSAKSSIKYAWYHVPILSDAPSAEFIRFRKYTTGDILDENGKKRTYDDVILDKLVDLVNQEYDRIMLVRERDDAYQSGNKRVEPIANYDIIRKEDGSIKSKGGSEFKFLPALNNYKNENGEAFIDALSRIKREGSGEELRNFIRRSVADIMDEGFEQTYRDWSRIGLLDELPNGKYKYLPFSGQSRQNAITAKALNKAEQALGNLWTTNMELLLSAYVNNNPFSNKEAEIQMQLMKTLIDEQVQAGNLSLQEANSITKSLFVKNNAKDALREYYWNSKLATSQIIELTATDLAYYKNLEDFQKRYKEVHAPALRMNTKATYKGELIGREFERTIYLKDDEIVSSVLDDIKEVLDARVAKGEMSKLDRDQIVSQFKKVNVADAQAYRSLSSYRSVLGMSGQWTDAMEKAYNNFKAGNWDISNFNTIWQTKKPYVYTQVNADSGIDGHTGIKVGVQHKNSEFLLLAMHELVAGNMGKSAKLKAINKFMEDNNIDVVQFESTTKVGKQGVINLNDVNTEAEVLQRLKETTGIGTPNGENSNVVHKIPYEDYGFQTATPEHGIDAIQLVGTQIRKLITADIAEDVMIEADGQKMTKAEWLKLYNEVITENILQSFKEVDEIFQDPKEIEKVLQEEIRGSQRYGLDMQRACTLDENGNFNIPLFDPVQSQAVQTLLNSIIKSRITKQKIRGGALIQVSNYGLTDDLHIEFGYDSEGKKYIKHMECYLPAYSRKFYEPLMDPKTHQLDINKLPEDLRKAIGYRVPTEDKYSMVPIYIKGFLPQQNGSAVMLPAEITTLSGSDFDVDKLYIMLPEFNTTDTYRIADAWDDFYEENPDIVEEIDKNIGIAFEDYVSKHPEDSDLDLDDYKDFLKEQKIKNYQFSETAQKRFSQWFRSRKKNYKSGKYTLSKVKYDHSKTPSENGLKARNNLMIDLMWGVLTNADTASKILNPGGFDPQKKAARINAILEANTEDSLRAALQAEGIKLDRTRVSGETVRSLPVINYLFDLDLDTLDKIAESTKVKMDPLSPRSQVLLHQQNMTGAKLISIYANHNANHALIQHTQLELNNNGAFTLNGKKLRSLHDIMNVNKEFISKNNAGFLAASVDNVKDPVLAGLNQNTFTADSSMLLSRLGYSPLEVGLLMKQPIIVEMTNTYFRESRNGKGKDTIVDEVISRYKKRSSETFGVSSYEAFEKKTFDIEELANNIMTAKIAENTEDLLHSSNHDVIDYYNKQVAVGFLFKRIMSSADALAQVVAATRADTKGGAAGPTIADTEIKLQKVNDLWENIVNNPKFPLSHADVILNSLYEENPSMDSLRESILNSPLPFLQAFYTLGLQQSERMFKQYFPQYTQGFRDVVDTLRGMTKTGKLNVKTINNIYNDLLAYIMSNQEFFGKYMGVDSKVHESSEKRSDFINQFPEYFKKVVTDNPDIAALEFIKRLKVIRENNNNPVATLVFKNVGQLSSTLKERYMRDWTTLLYMENPEANKLALNLFLYSFYRNGFAFGPNTFIHLAPTAIRRAIPNYISTLRGLLTSNDTYDEFIDQYVYNHLDNRKLVPEVKEESTVAFVDENNNIKDEVAFIINDSTPSADKVVIKKTTDNDGEKSYEFMKYIGKRVRNNYIYYRLDESGEYPINEAHYTRIEPLGFRNSFIEYEYGKDVTEMKSVIEKNDKNYDPYADTLARYDTSGDNIDYDSIPDIEDYIPSHSPEDFSPANQAFAQVYGEGLEGISKQDNNDITQYSPATDFKDSNDEEVCGGKFDNLPNVYTL